MWMYLVAGLCLLLAIIFIVKFFLGNKKAKQTEANLGEKKPEITIEDGKASTFNKTAKMNLIIAFVFMALCEICILIGNRI